MKLGDKVKLSRSYKRHMCEAARQCETDDGRSLLTKVVVRFGHLVGQVIILPDMMLSPLERYCMVLWSDGSQRSYLIDALTIG